MAKQQKEYILQKQVCGYLKAQYPNVLFMSDTIAATRLTIPQANRNKAIQKEGFKTPDLIIFEARHGKHGLFIELKVESPFKKNGVELLKNEHIEAQAATMELLIHRGYECWFSWTYEMTIKIIDNYLKQ